ncbi:MAG: 2-amino-4-hydroxy-6-hydroxymethyldihydropteridine diphosphokinase [Bacteroidales bacterium]|nr:2-amino-4-hydroxy-6-hydroxymethyldihydropteridine diphosphokinase [Bacteroidales bacterium]MDD3431321.1 2-amino-4-hydroxy-6-hydroxymethyldihydropteridine diphosphokinase [Bacteroidales bacterium]MDD4361305.1 2-amino-4-hydroxy-6-hydroxymethyldihydropteridine diphosphokinase [Bacteroidales bacterium]MDD4430562.1 2-amino-4-hydroxy-6-hydroxymethyldihydropteridine diphosphokinase [Bacteroidales bacterium]
MAKLYLGLGSNLGDRAHYLERAIAEIQLCIGPVVNRSEFFSTEPWGFESPHTFLNACVCVETTLHWRKCLELTQEIEHKLGRTVKNGAVYRDREIDIDLLLYDQLVLNEPELVLPHPLMHKRKFVLQPLSRIAPELQHPVLKRSIQELLLAID